MHVYMCALMCEFALSYNYNDDDDDDDKNE